MLSLSQKNALDIKVDNYFWKYNKIRKVDFMKVPQALADKVNMCTELFEAANLLHEEIEAELCRLDENNGEIFITDFHVCDKPTGKLNNEENYVDEQRYGEDCFSGIYYYPIEGSDKFLAMAYEA